MQRRHARCQPARPTPDRPNGCAGSRAPTLSTPLNRPRAFRHLRRPAASAGVTPPAAREGKTAGPARSRRSRPTRQAHCAFEESGGVPKDACAIFANHRHVGEMAATIIATAVGPNLAPVWLGHRLSSCGQAFRLRGPDLIGDWGEAFRFDSHVQTGNACDLLRAGQAPKRVIITGMTVATDWLTD